LDICNDVVKSMERTINDFEMYKFSN
jgi:hypothetical protein